MQTTDQIRANRKGITGFPATAPETSRLVDWRFLLPNPNIGSVALINPLEQSLVDSLIPFCKTYQVFDPTISIKASKLFDGVVLQKPSLSLLAETKNLLLPGGWLYMEGRNPISRYTDHEMTKEGDSSLHSAESYFRTLLASGFTEIQVYWVWPDFRNNTKYISLDSSSALIYVLNKNKSGWVSSLKSFVIQKAVKSGLILRLVPNFCITARWGEA